MTAKHSYPAILPLFRQKPGLAEKFHSKVARREPDRCWPWLGSTNRDGYGQFRVGKRTLIASRAAAAIAHGEPDAAFVCHSCDNPICCNPAHLWFGSCADNVADREAKGRNAPMPTTAKLTPAQVSEIWSSKLTQRELALQYGVGKSTISHIKSGTTWRRLTSKQAS